VFGKKVSSEVIKTIGDYKEVSFRSLIQGNIKALPGVTGLLDILFTAGIKVALVSSTPRENIEMILGTLHLKKYFPVIVSGDDVTVGKPDPQGYLMGANRLGVNPAACVVIEDAIVGIQAARAGGMKCIAAATTHPAAVLTEADLVVNHLTDISLRDIINLERNKESTMERSLVLIKPDAMKRQLAGAILARLQEKGLKLIGLKLLHMDEALAKRHYAVHAEKPFFKDLVAYIISTPIVAMAFEGNNAIETIRKTMGATDPNKAEKGTIRADFGLDIQNNAVHGSDSLENAIKEIKLFFKDSEILATY
jgi:nucleoside-diphosphate kinase